MVAPLASATAESGSIIVPPATVRLNSITQWPSIGCHGLRSPQNFVHGWIGGMPVKGVIAPFDLVDREREVAPTVLEREPRRIEVPELDGLVCIHRARRATHVDIGAARLVHERAAHRRQLCRAWPPLEVLDGNGEHHLAGVSVGSLEGELVTVVNGTEAEDGTTVPGNVEIGRRPAIEPLQCSSPSPAEDGDHRREGDEPCGSPSTSPGDAGRPQTQHLLQPGVHRGKLGRSGVGRKGSPKEALDWQGFVGRTIPIDRWHGSSP